MTAQQLKNSILQLAVQGKLVPQDPNDEPASVLLERIRAEKEELIKAKKIKREKNPSIIFRGADNTPYEKIGNEVVPLDVPFDIPDTWEWIRGSSLGEIVRGSGIKRTETVEAGLPCVRYGELYTTYNISFSQAKSFIPKEIDDNCKHFSYGDVLMTLTGENKPDIAKAVAYLGETPIAAGGDLAFWTHHGLNPLYLVYLLNSPYAIYRKVELATGDIIVHISGDKIGSILLPIPPLAEQDRIVQRIQELETIVSEYGKKETELTQLQASFPEQMKKSILQWAVQGKLVPQDPTDEPADILLDRIRAEKESLIKAGKIKRDKHESVIFRRDNSHYEKRGSETICIDDELPFEIPVNWCWSRLGNCLDVRDGTHDTPKYVTNGIPLVTSKNLCNGKIDFTNIKYISYDDHRLISQRSKVDNGDIMYAMIGSIGNPVLYYGDKEFSIKNMALFKRIQNGLLMEYVYWFLFFSQDNMKKFASGGVQSFVSLNYLRNYLIPVPPIQEQRRIVALIERTIGMIDTL